MKEEVRAQIESLPFLAALGFTGTQNNLTVPQQSSLNEVFMLLWKKGAHRLHHGDCIGGDLFAHTAWRMLGGVIALHPPTDPKKRAFCTILADDYVHEAKPYLVRNAEIAARSQALVGAPKGMTEEQRGSGTWATIRHARRLNRPIILVYPNGDIEVERSI